MTLFESSAGTVAAASPARGQPPSQRLVLPNLRVALTLFACVLGVPIASHRAPNVTTFVSFLLCVILLLILHSRVRHLGYMSVGGIAFLLIAALFVGKWLVSGITPVADAWGSMLAPNPKALVVTAMALLGFTAPYVSITCLLSKREPARRVSPFAQREWVLLLTFSVVATAGRLWLAGYYNIGVPGVRPFPVPFAGVLYYLFTVGPLIGAAALIILARGRPAPERGAVVVLLLWTSVGVFVGWRGDPVKAVLVFLAARAVRPSLAHARRRNIPRSALRAVVVSVFLLLAVTVAINFRTGTRVSDLAPNRTFTFLAQRSGGIDFLSPVISSVDRHGISAQFVDSEYWDHYLRTRVYRLPATARTAFASTAFGWWYAVGGYAATVAFGAFFGTLAAVYDSRFHPNRGSAKSLFARLVLVAFVYSWAYFLLEGAPATSLKTLIAGGAISFLLDYATRLRVPVQSLR